MGEPLLRVAELRELESRAAALLPAGTLMQRAGAEAARAIDARLPRAAAVLIVCGPGNNGGDGYQTALHLRERGHRVQCVALLPAQADDARAARDRWQQAGGTILDRWPTAARCDAVVDAIFGIGLARPLAGAALDAARWIAAQRALKVALDVPSGLDADTGAWVGGVAGVQADATVTFIAGKPGLYTHAGVDACGAVEICSIGVDRPASRCQLTAPDDFASVLQPRRRDSHKGSYGDVLVVGGGAGMVGAALLAARAALRLGAGRVYVDCVGAPELKLDPLQPELMFRPQSAVACDAVCVAGCGLGTEAAAQATLAAALARSAPCVIDADGLNLLAADATLRATLAAAPAPRVLTPHPLEAARLLGSDAAAVQSDRVAAALALAQRFAAIVVLKGAGSVIAAPDGRTWINPTGGPALATPGSGDVLAGMIGALLAQGFEPLQAVLAAVWLHSAAADRFGADSGLVAGEVPALAAASLAALRRQP